MGFNSLRSKVQQAGNIFVRLALSKELQHFLFSLSKQVIRVRDMLVLKLAHVVCQQYFANRRTKKMALLADRFQGKGQIAFDRFFKDVPFHSSIQSSNHIVFIRVHAEQDDRGFRTSLQNLRSSIDAVDLTASASEFALA